MAKPFDLVAPFPLAGDQAQAVERLVSSFEAGVYAQTLLGVTGSGKTFTIAKVIAALNRPTLVLSHNKTLAAQLYQEFKGFFPAQRGRVLRLLLRLLPARGLRPLSPTPTSRRRRRSTRRSTACASPRRGRCSSGAT